MAGEIDFSAYRLRLADACKMIVNTQTVTYIPNSAAHLPFWLIDIRITRISRQNVRTFMHTMTADFMLIRYPANHVFVEKSVTQIETDVEAILDYWQDKTDFRTTNYPNSTAGIWGMVQLLQVNVGNVGIEGGNGQWVGARGQLSWLHQVTKNGELT